jgi:hypothetical protein
VNFDESEEHIHEDAVLNRLVVAHPERPAFAGDRIDVIVSSNNMKRTNAHLDDDLYSAGRDDLSITWFRAISPKSNPVILRANARYTVPEHREQKGNLFLGNALVSNATVRINSVFSHLGINSLVDVIQIGGNFSLMSKNPAELQTYGDVCFSVMGTRVR